MANKRRPPARNEALEQRVIDAPDDPTPRLVYGDWLQSVGDPLGEWVARSASGTRALQLEHLEANADVLLGRAAGFLRHGWIGWHHGFVDEVRIQPPLADSVRRLAALLASPIGRFVRRIALGLLARTDDLLDIIADAAPPLLAEVLAVNGRVDALARLGTVRRLGLFGASIDVAMPGLTELSLVVPSPASPWVVRGGCVDVEVLTIDCRTTPAPLEPLLRALPRLREVRVVGVPDRRIVDDQLAPHAGRLSLVEVSDTHEAWIGDRVRAGGRDAVRLIPSAGVHLYNAGTHLLRGGHTDDASVLLDAAITLPQRDLGTLAWANAAIAHERAGRFTDAARTAREGLARAPDEPNLHAILIDALRRDGRLGEAVAGVPRATAAIDARKGTHKGGAAACLIDCLVTLAQAGRHDEVIALAARMGTLAQARAQAVVAMSRLALGESIELEDGDDPLVLHARAAMLVARDPDRAVALLTQLKAASYTEWHWIARDPNLAPLGERLRALLT